ERVELACNLLGRRTFVEHADDGVKRDTSPGDEERTICFLGEWHVLVGNLQHGELLFVSLPRSRTRSERQAGSGRRLLKRSRVVPAAFRCQAAIAGESGLCR